MEPLPGNAAVQDKIIRMAGRAMDMAPAMAAILSSYHHIESERFAQGGPGWTPLKDTTITRKENLGQDNGILIRGQDMMYSFIGGGDETVVIGEDFMEVTSNIAYAHFHQDGSTVYPDGSRLPQRKIVDIEETSPTALLWFAILQGYLDDGVAVAASEGEVASVL